MTTPLISWQRLEQLVTFTLLSQNQDRTLSEDSACTVRSVISKLSFWLKNTHLHYLCLSNIFLCNNSLFRYRLLFHVSLNTFNVLWCVWYFCIHQLRSRWRTWVPVSSVPMNIPTPLSYLAYQIWFCRHVSELTSCCAVGSGFLFLYKCETISYGHFSLLCRIPFFFLYRSPPSSL